MTPPSAISGSAFCTVKSITLTLRLFERGARALKLTDEGRALFERTAILLTELDETAAAIASRGHNPRGRLRISAPLLFSQIAMGRIAAGFAIKFPEISLEVTTEDRAVDMVEEADDQVIRVNPTPDDALVGRVFLQDRIVAVASSDLRRSVDAPVPAVVRGAIGQRQTWELATASGKTNIQVDPILGLSSLVMVRDAVRAGAGVARLPLSLVSHDLLAGTRVHWGDMEGPGTVPLASLSQHTRLGIPRPSQGSLPTENVGGTGRVYCVVTGEGPARIRSEDSF